jgi:sulfur relay (sulfurtransferase) DsrF/TusC family protein
MFKFECDHATTTGFDHLKAGGISQDYCVSGQDRHFDGPIAYAIVSDGCSSGGDTDIGSRLMCISARAQIIQLSSEFNYSALYGWLKFNLSSQESGLEISPNDMLATCIAARADQANVNIFFYGDGVAAFRYRDGSISIVKLEWSDNAPLYLTYRSDAVDQLTKAGATLTKRTIHPDGSETVELFDLSKHREGSVLTVPTSSVTDVAIFSDGVTQIRNAAGDTEDWIAVVKDLLAFKGYGGVFVKRRLVNGFLPTRVKTGFKPYDDLSYGVIHIEDDVPEVKDGQ